MSRKKPKWLDVNLPNIMRYCEDNNFTIVKINEYQYRIAGATSLIDVWPSRMKVHIIASENPVYVNDYRQLSNIFMADDLDELLK